MFDNIGGKIKTLAQVICWIGIIASVVFGFVFMSPDESLILPGFIFMGIGSLISWISSFISYGLGQLIENTDKLVAVSKQLTKSSVLSQSMPQTNTKNHVQVEHQWRCTICGNMISDEVCPYCGNDIRTTTNKNSFCKACGVELKENQRFCHSCGQEI